MNNLPSNINHKQRQWLNRSGALTFGLRTLGKLEIHIIDEYSSILQIDELACLQQKRHSPIWVREIVMSIDQVPAVAARSITPLNDSLAYWKGIRKLNTKPLADILYNNIKISRSPFEFSRLQMGQPFFHTIRKAKVYTNGDLLARRSNFCLEQRPLLVAECFLPAFWSLLKR